MGKFKYDKVDGFNCIIDNSEKVLAICSEDSLGKNARFIVSACNSHYELLNACKEALSILSVQDGRVKELLEKVIAKAEGK